MAFVKTETAGTPSESQEFYPLLIYFDNYSKGNLSTSEP